MQFPLVANDTGRLEEAVAETEKSGSPYVWSAMGSNVMVWPARRNEEDSAASPSGELATPWSIVGTSVHATMGDSEVSGSAVEISAAVTLHVDLVKGTGLRRPWFETQDSWITFACAPTLEAAQRLNLATTAVALVFDTASFGPTSPIQGQRYRLEVTPTFGTINFTGVLVDYRRYVMPVSFYTIAARVIHYGRYGPDADDGRLYPIYLNDPGFVRGYNSRGYSTRCTPTPAGDCDRYTGSRMLLGNVELRFPMLRPFQVSREMYGPLPIELALFADSGVAWNGREKPAIVGGSRRGITSAGLAVRMRLGFAVAEFDVTRPFQRSDQGMVFGFNLSPGW